MRAPRTRRALRDGAAVALALASLAVAACAAEGDSAALPMVVTSPPLPLGSPDVAATDTPASGDLPSAAAEGTFEGFDLAGRGGYLEVGESGDCLTLRDLDGDVFSVGWPQGWAQVVHDDGSGELRDEDGNLVAVSGDLTEGGGGGTEGVDSCGNHTWTFYFHSVSRVADHPMSHPTERSTG